MKEYMIVILVMAVALAMDAFAVAITLGMDCGTKSVRSRLKIGLVFGFCQGLLFVLGIGSLSLVSGSITIYNHFIAGGILVILGLRMIKETFSDVIDLCPNVCCKQRKCKEVRCLKTGKMRKLTYSLLLIYGIATSIDALAAGITYGLIYEFKWISMILIGTVAFMLSYIGATFGRTLGHLIGNKANLIGGFILIGLGIKALFF